MGKEGNDIKGWVMGYRGMGKGGNDIRDGLWDTGGWGMKGMT